MKIRKKTLKKSRILENWLLHYRKQKMIPHEMYRVSQQNQREDEINQERLKLV
jgi:hypothetical protein